MSYWMADILKTQSAQPTAAHDAATAKGRIALAYDFGGVLNPCTEFDPHGPPSG
jgi:hypothetical protein